MMTTILVVDDMAIFREPIAASLRVAGFGVLTAGNGVEALELIARETVDLVLLDLAMPRLDGVGVLEKLRGTPAWQNLPVILLTASSDKSTIVRAARLGIQGCLLKSQFSLQELTERIGKCLGAAAGPVAPALAGQEPTAVAETVDKVAGVMQPWPASAPSHPAPARPVVDPHLSIPQLLSREVTIARMEEQTKTKTLAGVVAQVIAMTGSVRGDLSDLVTVLERDPLLASRVLHVANSAAFATKKVHITTLEEAVRNIGLKAVRNIACSIGVFEAFPTDGADGFNLIRCWQHSFAVASIMEWLSANLEEADQDLSHLVGLCHDLGEIVLRQCCAEEFEIALQYATQTGRPLAEIQSSIFGLSSSELTGVVLTKLGLPPQIAGPIHEFSESLRTDTKSALSPLTRVLIVANTCAHGLLLASSPEALIAPISPLDLQGRRSGGSIRPYEGLRVRSEILVTTHLLARLSSADEDKLMRPMITPTPRRIWYAHHPTFTALDPVATALQLIAHVSVKERLPTTPEELAEVDMLVVTTPRPHLDGFSLAELERRLKLAGKKDLPVLYLTGALNGAVTPPQMRMRVAQYPISIAALAGFVEEVAEAKGAQGAARMSA